jgi:hypothetical protein
MEKIKKSIFRLICLFKLIFYKLIFSENLFKINVSKWFVLNWDQKYLINHKLNNDSIIFEVWWYTWVFSDKMIELYDPIIYIFEPVQKYFDILIDKYKNNKKIKVFHFWLSDKDSIAEISLLDDWSSIFKNNWEKNQIILKDIIWFLEEEKLNDKKIDLISINIEWGEYQLLEKLLNFNSNFNFIQVQFHDFVEDAKIKRDKILNLLINKWYINAYSFPFVWEWFKMNNK